MQGREPNETEAREERLELLAEVESWLERPMLVLALLWLLLLVAELTIGLSPFLNLVGILIWAAFVVEFAVRLVISPEKVTFLRRNWLTALALLTPALRLLRLAPIFRALRVARAGRGLRAAKLVGGFNRSFRTLRRNLGRRRFGYVLSVTLVILVLGSAGMFSFERVDEGGSLANYGDAVWFTAMILSTLGSEYWPSSPEGRLLTFLLALYSFAVFGYLTATLASFFIGRDAEDQAGEVAGSAQLRALASEIAALRGEVQRLSSSGTHDAPGDDAPREF